jgi:hypothetical protein
LGDTKLFLFGAVSLIVNANPWQTWHFEEHYGGHFEGVFVAILASILWAFWCAF